MDDKVETPMPLVILAGIAGGSAVVAIGLYHVAIVGPRLRSLARILRGDGDPVDGESLVRLRLAQEGFERASGSRLDALESLVRHDLIRTGFLRFNSFSDVGSDLSYALALLNEQGDGVVITSIYSREETRTYGKSVRRFVPAQGASKEEQTAISMTRKSGDSGAA